MAIKTKKPKMFLVVWHDQQSPVIVGSPMDPKVLPDLVIQPGHKVVADDAWENIPHFARDVADGKLHTMRSPTVPANKELTFSAEYEPYLNSNQKELAKLICMMDFPFSAQVMENIQLHKLMGPGGIPKQGVKVTRKFLSENHRPLLMATAEMEKGHRNRPEVLKILEEAVQAIDSL